MFSFKDICVSLYSSFVHLFKNISVSLKLCVFVKIFVHWFKNIFSDSDCCLCFVLLSLRPVKIDIKYLISKSCPIYKSPEGSSEN